MTDRLDSLTVVLSEDIRVDDAEPLIAAIKQLKGVLSVTGSKVEPANWVARERVRHEIGRKLLEIIYGIKP